MKAIIKQLMQLTFFTLLSLTFSWQTQAQKSLFDLSATSLFTQDKDFVDVDQAFQFDFDQSDQQVIVKFKIKDGYYLYRHQFKFPVKNAKISSVKLPKGIDHKDEFFGIQQIYKHELSFPINILQADKNASIKIRYQGCAAKGLCYPPTTKIISLPELAASKKASTNQTTKVSNQQAVLSALSGDKSVNIPTTSQTASTVKTITNASEQNRLADMLKQDSLLLTLLAFFAGGLLLSFTPCVFPMYPILTGIIVGQGDGLTTKKAFTLSFFYVQGMAITYTILGVVVALAGAQFQAAFQAPAVLIGLSILFVFLALSMFGVFNLALPSSWQNKLNNISGKQKGGSIVGVVIMGVISGLVASPCTTAPLTGALLYISQTGNVALGASALYALSLGMGIPLLILGSSGGKLLPKAGNWMNIIKNIFGLLLLAVPIFLLSRIIPDSATQWLWIVLLLASASYFYVVNQNSTNNSSKGFWYGFRSLIIFIALFFGANLAYQLIFPSVATVPSVESQTLTNATTQNNFIKVKSLAELTQAVKIANQQGKTVMVDLYADWCVACKEFEHYTFNKPNVKLALTNTRLIQIDLTDTASASSREIMSHFNIFGLPSILFFDLKGNELSQNRVTGFMNANNFTQHINNIFHP
jgi:thiol:disulfide interchange protein DsbD